MHWYLLLTALEKGVREVHAGLHSPDGVLIDKVTVLLARITFN